MKKWVVICLTVMCVMGIVKVSKAELITINSGVNLITYIESPTYNNTTGFDKVFTDTDFSAARTGPLATVYPPVYWGPHGQTSPDAKWITGTLNPASVLYAVPFNITEAEDVKLDFLWLIDNSLGNGLSPGLFINGVAISKINLSFPDEFSTVELVSLDITDHIILGQNYLYVYQCDYGVVSGSQFTAYITAVPEPMTIALIGIGGLILTGKRSIRKK